MTSSAQRRESPPLAPLTPGGGPAGRLDSLTGLRWIAAFAVFLSHVSTLLPLPGTKAVFSLGSSGVTFFFVLSGFVLTWTYMARDRVGPFYGRRFARIWPLLAIGVAIPLLLQLPDAQPGQSNTLTLMALSAVLLYQAWIPSYILGSTNPVTWSLACEAFFYAIFPFVAKYAVRRSLRWLGWAAVVLLMVGWGIKVWLWEAYPPQARPAFTGMDGLIFGTYSPIARVWEFLLGMVAAAAVRKGWRSPLGVRSATALLAAGFFVLWLLRDETWRLAVAYDALGQVSAPLFALVIVAVAQRDLTGGASWLRARPMVALGKWSYAFYLLHFTVLFEISSAVFDKKSIIEFYIRPVQPSWSNAGWALLALAITLAVCALLYQFYERPVERWLRNRIGRRAAHVPAPAIRPVAAESHRTKSSSTSRE
ncbi:acyltransferase [Streptomyces sp. SID13666]|uniref:acyltransferase family protein n=1 Tax=unclassified Streptomyces TaxID=2593676 RepID=UPI0013C03A77|nr:MULTISPECIES: acyltransferase [unclassified Streptomyces]NEA55105.1 acyltransferase [Streptomyces sp. SID13666]NEA71112.1 acyltransferase [Streptomyces sp. SID13588]